MKPIMFCCGFFAVIFLAFLGYGFSTSGSSIQGIEHSFGSGMESYIVLYRDGTVDDFQISKASGGVSRTRKYWRLADQRDGNFLAMTGARSNEPYLVIADTPEEGYSARSHDYSPASMYRYPSDDDMKALEDIRRRVGN